MKNSRRKIISVAILEGYCKDNAFSIEKLIGPPPPEFKMIPHICTYDEGIEMLEMESADLFIVKGPITHSSLKVLTTEYEHFFAVIPIDDPLSKKR